MSHRAHLLSVDHGLDQSNRENCKTALRDRIQKRLDAGLTIAFISESLHHGHDFMKLAFREPDDTATWLWSTWFELGVGARSLVRMKISGVDDLTHPLWDMGNVQPLYQGIGALAILKVLRQAKGVTMRDMARMMTVSRSNIYAIEESGNPRVSTLQRYARALDERVTLRVIPYQEGGNK